MHLHSPDVVRSIDSGSSFLVAIAVPGLEGAIALRIRHNPYLLPALLQENTCGSQAMPRPARIEWSRSDVSPTLAPTAERKVPY